MGQKLPSWARRGELCRTLPFLVEIELINCSCEQVPVFSQLNSLKRLVIGGMDRVEYMEDGVGDSYSSSSSNSHQGMQTLFFPSLVKLVLDRMKNIKGWWKGVEAIESSSNTSSSNLVGVGQQYDDHPLFMQFSKLSELRITNCPELKYLPYCPKVEVLKLKDNNERLSVLKTAIHLSISSDSGRAALKLKDLGTDNVEHQLISLHKQCWHQLSSLTIHYDDKIVNTQSVGEVFETLSNSLRSLKFDDCHKLRSISRGLEHLSDCIGEIDLCALFRAGPIRK